MDELKPCLKDLVLQERDKGNVVFMTFDGAMSANLEKFLEQPADGVLYDLNRDGATALTFLDDPKWTNDFAVSLVIPKLMEQRDSLRAELSAAQAQVTQLQIIQKDWGILAEERLEYENNLEAMKKRLEGVLDDIRTETRQILDNPTPSIRDCGCAHRINKIIDAALEEGEVKA